MNISVGSGGPRVTVVGPMTYEQKKEKKSSYSRAGGIKKNDNVLVYCMSKEQRGKLSGFSYTPATAKTGRLQRDSYRLQGKLSRLHSSSLPANEKSKQTRRLKCQLEYVNRQLSLEAARAPRTHVIIDEI